MPLYARVMASLFDPIATQQAPDGSFDPTEVSFSDPSPYSKVGEKASGSVFLNNTTYAGCDIKVVVNLYDGGKLATEQIKFVKDQLDKMQREYEAAIASKALVQLKLDAVHRGVPEANLLTTDLDRYNFNISSLQDTIISLQKQLTDMTKTLPQKSSKVLAECQTLSLSTYRDKRPVRACGSVYPKGFTRGPRELAGSLVFTVFDQHVLWDLISADASDFDSNTAKAAIADQLPPLDILVLFANEYGSLSRMAIYGVEFVSEGQTMSIEDLLTENAINFVARDYDPMRKVGSLAKIDETSGQVQRELVNKKASDLLREDDYKEFQKDSPYDRFSRRRNPFL